MLNKVTLINKSIATLMLLLTCRMGVFVPFPGNIHDECYRNVQNNGFLNLLTIFSGQRFSAIEIFGHGIKVYIN